MLVMWKSKVRGTLAAVSLRVPCDDKVSTGLDVGSHAAPFSAELSPGAVKSQDCSEERLEAEPHGPNGDTTSVPFLSLGKLTSGSVCAVEARWMVPSGISSSNAATSSQARTSTASTSTSDERQTASPTDENCIAVRKTVWTTVRSARVG